MTPLEYLRKMRGTTRGGPPRVALAEIAWSGIGGFLGVAAIFGFGRLFLDGRDQALVIASFGASAVLLFGAPRSTLAQPRHLVGGHFLSALVGVACWQFLHAWPIVAAAAAVAAAIAVMHATRTLHPPGGATALTAVIGTPEIHDLGFFYAIVPCTAGPLVLLAVAVLVNNLPGARRYPEYWT